MKKNKYVAATAAVVVAAAIATTAAMAANGKADKPLPRQAIDQVRNQLVDPPSDPNSMAGIVDPAKATGFPLIERDPQTGNVVRDPATGLPQVVKDDQGNAKLFKPGDIPADQLQAQAKHEEKQARADKGDKQAQKELKDEDDLTARAIEAHPNGK